MAEIVDKLTEMSGLVRDANIEVLNPVAQGLADMSETIAEIKTSFEAAICKPIPEDIDESIVNIKDELTSAKTENSTKDKKIRSLEKETKILCDRNTELESQLKT